MGTTIGIRIPNVPQAVPIEKERNAAIAKTKTGRSIADIPELVTTPSMNCGACRRSRHTPESVHARIRMMFAGSIIFMPSTAPFINSLNVTKRRGTNIRSATTMAEKDAHTSEIDADELPMAAMKVWYCAPSPQ